MSRGSKYAVSRLHDLTNIAAVSVLTVPGSDPCPKVARHMILQSNISGRHVTLERASCRDIRIVTGKGKVKNIAMYGGMEFANWC